MSFLEENQCSVGPGSERWILSSWLVWECQELDVKYGASYTFDRLGIHYLLFLYHVLYDTLIS